MTAKKRTVCGLAAGLAVLILISFLFGRYPVSVRELGGLLLSRFITLEPFWSKQAEVVLFQIRLPRIMLAALVGGGLAAAGAAFQGIFKNPMASPDLLGASAGAAFGAALALLLGADSSGVVASAFVFSLTSMALVWLISRHASGRPILTLILAGIVVGSLFSAATSFIKLVADPNNQLPAITYWLMGSFANTQSSTVLFALVPMAAGLLPLLALRWRINVLTLGDDEARSIGVDAPKVRLVIILCATLVTAASVAVSGVIGWVGLVVPHLARRLVGNNYALLLPASALAGAVFLLAVDDLSRNLLATEIPIGILTAFIGAPFFLYLMMKGERV